MYGINTDEIDKTVADGHIPVIIVRPVKIVKRIKEDFNDVKMFFIMGVYGDALKEKLLSQGRSEDDIGASQEGVVKIIHECIKNIDVINRCILNCLYDEKSYIKQFMRYAV